MKLRLVLLSSLAIFLFSCNATVDNSEKIKALEDKIDNLSESLGSSSNDSKASKSSNDLDRKKINARLNSLESSLKKLEKSVATLSKNQGNNKKQPRKPSGPWKRDYTYKTTVGDSYYQGPKDAKVVITEWSDYY